MRYLILALNFAFFGWTWLRETPEFWLNSGGYPVWLRELTPPLYYPCLTLLAAVLAVQLLPGGRRRNILGWLCYALAFLVFCLSLLVLVANNLENIIEGRPLHYHPI